jgi:hypothetical protein
MATGATVQELDQSRIGGHEPVSLFPAVAPVEGNRDRFPVGIEDPPNAPSVLPAADQGDDLRAALHRPCIPSGAVPPRHTPRDAERMGRLIAVSGTVATARGAAAYGMRLDTDSPDLAASIAQVQGNAAIADVLIPLRRPVRRTAVRLLVKIRRNRGHDR